MCGVWVNKLLLVGATSDLFLVGQADRENLHLAKKIRKTRLAPSSI